MPSVPTPQRHLGVFQILLSGACFGFLGYFGKTAYSYNIEPFELLGLRFLIAALLMRTFFLIKKQRPWTLLKGKEILSSLGLGIFGYAVFSSCYFLALKGISASLTVLLLYTYPVLVSLGSYFFFGERLGKQGFLALLLSIVGLAGLVWGEWELSHPFYLSFGLGAAFFYALYILLSRRLVSHVRPELSTFYIQLGAGVALCFLAFNDFERPAFILNTYPFLIVSVAGLCSVIAITLFQAGLQKLSASETSILSTSEPLFGVIVATILLGESLQPIQIAGGILVLLSMVILAKRKIPVS